MCHVVDAVDSVGVVDVVEIVDVVDDTDTFRKYHDMSDYGVLACNCSDYIVRFG